MGHRCYDYDRHFRLLSHVPLDKTSSFDVPPTRRPLISTDNGTQSDGPSDWHGEDAPLYLFIQFSLSK